MKNTVGIVSLLILILGGCDLAQDPVDHPGELGIPVWDITAPYEEYASLQDNKWSKEAMPVLIHSGSRRFHAHIRAQGAGSRYFLKWSYRVIIDSADYYNDLQEFNLSTLAFDKTMLRTVVALRMFEQAGFHPFSSSHVFVNINGRRRGLFAVNERIEEPFFERRALPVYELVKAGFEASYTLSEAGDLSQSFSKEIPDDNNLSNLKDLFRALDTSAPEKVFEVVGAHLDIEQYLRYHALASIMNHCDGFSNNIFLYKSAFDEPYRIIPWDFDQSLKYESNYDIYGRNEIIKTLFTNDSCVSMFVSEMKSLLNTGFTEHFLFPVIDSVAAAIRTAYDADPYLGGAGFSLDDEISRLKSFITGRRNDLLKKMATFAP